MTSYDYLKDRPKRNRFIDDVDDYVYKKIKIRTDYDKDEVGNTDYDTDEGDDDVKDTLKDYPSIITSNKQS